MRRLSYFANFIIILCAASPGAAAIDSDSTVSVARIPSPAEQFTLYLERDGTRNAVYIEPRADGMAAITRMDSTIEYVPLYRIRRIEDAGGVDRTFDVTRRGRRLGTQVPKEMRQLSPAVWKAFRFLAGPRSVCGSYMITDFAMMLEMGGFRDGSYFESVDYGYARNVGRYHSLGATAFLGMDFERTHAGLRLRLYRWLSRDASVDISPGVILTANEEGGSRFLAPGFAGQVGVTVVRRFGFVAQVFSVRKEYRYPAFSPLGTAYGFRSKETALHLGFRLGGEPGVAATVPGLLIPLTSSHTFRPTP